MTCRHCKCVSASWFAPRWHGMGQCRRYSSKHPNSSYLILLDRRTDFSANYGIGSGSPNRSHNVASLGDSAGWINSPVRPILSLLRYNLATTCVNNPIPAPLCLSKQISCNMVLKDVIYRDKDGDKCIRRDNGNGTYNVLVERKDGSRYVWKRNVSYKTSKPSKPKKSVTRKSNNGVTTYSFCSVSYSHIGCGCGTSWTNITTYKMQYTVRH
jgi:hypothetical protein